MAQLRIFTDEDVYGAVAAQLRNSGFDVVSTPDADQVFLISLDLLKLPSSDRMQRRNDCLMREH